MRPSAARVARAWLESDVQAKIREFKSTVALFIAAVEARDPRGVGNTWVPLINQGRPLANWVLETRSVPRGSEKAAEMAVRLFLTTTGTRDVLAWTAKNLRHITTFVAALSWPARATSDEGSEGSEESFNLAGFKVHNTLNLTGSSLQSTKDVIERAAKAVRSMRLPKAASILYGNLFVVGRLQQPRTLAWYNPMTDEVFIRPHIKVGSEEAHNLIHELGHRYWFKEVPADVQKLWKRYHMRAGYHLPPVRLPQPGEVFPIPITGRKGVITVERIEGDKIFLSTGGNVSRRKIESILRTEITFPTLYAATSDSEHFAEAFAMYALGVLGTNHVKAFEAIIIRGEDYDPRAIT